MVKIKNDKLNRELIAMLIVGEQLNTSRKRIAEAVTRRDGDYIAMVARRQAEAGADYIDVNAGTFVQKESELLCWMVKTVQAAVDLPLCLDSPDPKAIAAAIEVHRGEPMINSISLEKDRFASLLPVVTANPCRIIALCMAETAMPRNDQERLAAAGEIINRLSAAGVEQDKIHIDPLIQPVSVDTAMGLVALRAITSIRENYPQVHIICGLSNVSFGLPSRGLLNRSFLSLAMQCGLSSVIFDPTDDKMMATLRATEVLLDNDQYCEKYIDAFQAGLLEPK